jgi:hypothetical protein
MRQVRITVAALITLASLAVNAVFHLPWFDSMAALAVIPSSFRREVRPGKAMLADAVESGS